MGSIRVEKAAAIGPQILDDLQRGDWTLRYDLQRTFDGSDDGIGMEVHRNALPDQQRGTEQCSGQKDPEQSTCQINPKVAQRVGELPGKASNEGDAHGQTRGASQKVLRAESDHLAEIAHRVLARVSLPGRSRREADRRIQIQIW